MLYRALADLVVLVHLAFVLFVVLGGLLVLRWRWMSRLHLPAVAWGAAVELFGWVCPLTPLENRLREAGGADAYAGGFVERYVGAILYPRGLTPELQVLLACLLVGGNLAIYAVVWRRSSAGGPDRRPDS